MINSLALPSFGVNGSWLIDVYWSGDDSSKRCVKISCEDRVQYV